MSPQTQYLIGVLQAQLQQEQANLVPTNQQIQALQKQIDAIKSGQTQHATNIGVLEAHIALLQKE